MKIGITCYPTYGGSGVVATELGKALAMRGHEVHFISYAMPTRLNGFIDNIFYHEVEINNYPLFEFPLYSIALASKMVEVTKFHDLDLLHAHYAIPHATSAFLAREILKSESGNKSEIKFITTLHGTDITLTGLEPSFLPTMKFSIQKSDGVTAVSKFLKEKTQQQYQIDKEIEVIPNFIDINKYVREDNEKTKCFRKNFAKNDEKILTHTSNFRALKRVQDVIKIFNTVKEKVDCKLLLIGDGPERSECERYSRELGIFEDIKFMGKQDALVELLSVTDLFFLPSQSESFGLSALEAMSCGVPVISSSVGGLPELNLHGETGYIAEIGDVERMSKYASDLLTNEKRYEHFSKNARKRAEHFSEENIVPMYEKFYDKVLGM
ncbi:MAG TPA: N-acetyl-alpha-D-glucosaminyl L-malate synthase BshA [Ignavibacteria bacterium]|nr:N-acetyl-alpha-D-glucosaminyl L-malate synthase BshA [Bacteroidota bacterium]HRI85156.1 N-acetyl-alpha-D-glucosaminyl L-malate synthase BshA [Ignavibacteria bacterium]HRJ99498.1 N-acetyl-alpha-D-glucosaminyl L-malate synthase BshA [Ignavibacteria bacterium]HRK00086.1 N-acetyl-alpha-D-glucosaminyl L-malate synthase BshA [Ignavibacteria bacterium]